MIVLVDLQQGDDGQAHIAPDSWHRLELAVEREMAPTSVSGCLGWIRSVLETEGANYKQVAVDVWRTGWTWRPSENDAYLRAAGRLDYLRAERQAELAEAEKRENKQMDLFGG